MEPCRLGTQPLPVSHAGLAQHPSSQCSQAAFPECLAEPQPGQPCWQPAGSPFPVCKCRETSRVSSAPGALAVGRRGWDGIFLACQPFTSPASKRLLLNWKMCKGEKQEIYRATNG